jgi:hypothetical protein
VPKENQNLKDKKSKLQLKMQNFLTFALSFCIFIFSFCIPEGFVLDLPGQLSFPARAEPPSPNLLVAVLP